MNNSIAKRIQLLQPSATLSIAARASALRASGQDVISLSLGEPDFPTPKIITQAATEALLKNKTRYTHALGLLELRQSICDFYFQEYGVSITPDQVLVITIHKPSCPTARSNLFIMLAKY